MQYTLLIGNGTLGPLFLETRQPFKDDFELRDCRIEYVKPTKNKNKDRRGEEGVIAFLEFQKNMKTYSKGDILITDNERAFDTELILDLLEDMGVEKLNFPLGLGHLMNPCDNEFQSEDKSRYYNIIAGLNIMEMDLKKKCEAIHGAYYGGKEESIINYFHKCGILGNEDPEEIAKKLLGESIYGSPKFQEEHEEQIEAYHNWKNLKSLKKQSS